MVESADRPIASDNNALTGAGDEIVASSGRWNFGADVAKHFDCHVSKSVPFYQSGHDLITGLSEFFIKHDSVCYDLGCSTGNLIARLAQKHADYPDARFVGLDIEAPMVAWARQNHPGPSSLSFQAADITSYEFAPCDVVISYYVIQFIPPKLRQPLFDKIYSSLNWGGAFILFEKTRASDARFQDIATTLYNEYKISQGYTPEEIISKSSSLKGVLEPYSTQANLGFLQRAGFTDIMLMQKYLSFEGILAIK